MNFIILRKLLFLIIIVFSCFSNMNRPDFNIALFSFGYLLWDQKNTMHKVRMAYLIVFTLIVDLVWLIYWNNFWDQAIFQDKWNKGIHTFVIIVNFLNFFFKVDIDVNMNLDLCNSDYLCF